MFLKQWVPLILAVALFAMIPAVMQADQSQEAKASTEEGSPPIEIPDLSDIIPLASELFVRSADLEARIAELLDIAAIEESCSKIEGNLEIPVADLEELKAEEHRGLNRLERLGEAVRHENRALAVVMKPLGEAIDKLEVWRMEWLTEKKQWPVWKSSLQQEGELAQLKLTFTKVDKTIASALGLILPQLNAMLASQEKVSRLQIKIRGLATEIEDLIEERRLDTLFSESPPMFSSLYFAQFGSDMRYALERGLADITWPGKEFFARQGWIIFIQICLALFISLTLFRKRDTIKKSDRWRFLALRPFSAGLFFFSMTAMLIYAYMGAPPIWKLANTALAALCFARLSTILDIASWKKRFIYGLMIVVILFSFMDLLSFPLPLYRLFAVFASIVGFVFCLFSAGENRRSEEASFYTWLLGLGSVFFAVIFVTECWGKNSVASYLFAALIDSLATVLVFMLFLYILHGGVEWLFRSSPLQRAAVFRENTEDTIDRVSNFFDMVVIGLFLLPALLMIWGVYDNLGEATKGLLALGITLGKHRITVGLLIVVAAILYGTYFVSWILQKFLVDVTFARRHVAMGVRHSIARLVHYVVSVAGFLLALSVLGFEISKITILLSALGVGIGFGLQGIVNNFVCGLILLFERPVRVGDIIEVGGEWAEIKRIGARATTVQTFDQSDIIVPNADLIANQVTNWTLSNRRARLKIPVGVAYGSDVSQVMEILLDCVHDHPKLVKSPAPQVLFLSFGDSALDFELRVVVLDANTRASVQSELHQEIDRRFREAKIEIAFPQQDLHLRSMDESILVRSSEKAAKAVLKGKRGEKNAKN